MSKQSLDSKIVFRGVICQSFFRGMAMNAIETIIGFFSILVSGLIGFNISSNIIIQLISIGIIYVVLFSTLLTFYYWIRGKL